MLDLISPPPPQKKPLKIDSAFIRVTSNVFYLPEQVCDDDMTSSVLQNGNWQDRTCDERHGFICMKQSSIDSTGDEVYVDIGCKFVSQGCTVLFCF